MEFRTGDIILFHTKVRWYKPLTWLTAAIRFFSKSYYNHAGTVVINWDVTFLNEAIETGVISIPLKDRLDGKDIKVLRRKTMRVTEKVFATKANSKLGHTGYDFSGLLWYQLIFQLTGCWLGHTGKAAEGRMYCGEYSGWTHQDLFPEYWKTAPADIDRNEGFLTIFKGIYKVGK